MQEAFAGFGVLAQDRDAGLVVLLAGAQTLVRGALNVLIVVAALGTLHMGESGVGVLTAAIGAGGFAGSLIAMDLVGRRLAVPIGIGLLLWGLPIAAMGLVPRPIAAMAFLAILGGGNALFDVAIYTLLQRLIPDEFLSRIFGILFGLAMGAAAVGSILIPPLIHAVGARAAMIVTGAFLPVLAALTWRRLMAVDRRTPVHTAQVRLLQDVPLFASLSVAASEYLARNVSVVSVPASTTLIVEGDAGDRFYVVASGEFDVARHGKHVATAGPGGFFGEISLLRDIPRQATVTATEDSTVCAFEGRDFVAAVTGHALSDHAAQELIEARLSENERSDRPPAAEGDVAG
jgi:MFS family permease